MKKTAFYFALILSVITASCSEDNEDTPPVPTLLSPVLVFEGTIEMAYLKSQDPDPSCFLNLTNGETYTVSEGLANSENIDMVWGSRAVAPDQKYLVSPSSTDVFYTIGGSADLWQGESLYEGWTNYNNVQYWDFVRGGFEEIVTNADFDAYREGKTVGLDYIHFDGTQSDLQRSILFDTSRGNIQYVGIIKFTASNLNARTANYTIKIRSI